MDGSFPVIRNKQHIDMGGHTVTIGETRYAELCSLFPDDILHTQQCSGGCHREVWLRHPNGRIRIAFDPDTLHILVLDLDPSLPVLDLLAPYDDPGIGKGYNHVHGDASARHIQYARLGMDLCLDRDGNVAHVGFGLPEYDPHAVHVR